MSDDFPTRDTSGSIPPPPPGTPPPPRSREPEPPEPEPGPPAPAADAAPAVADSDRQMVADMLRGYAEDITGLSARLDRFGSNAPVAGDLARDQATALSQIASELLTAADEI